MNLRISQGQLRFRIARGELTQLMAGCVVQLTLPLLAHPHRYQIQTGESEYPLLLKEEKDTITLVVDHNTLVEFATHLPSREGIKHKTILNNEECHLLLEVDVRRAAE